MLDSYNYKDDLENFMLDLADLSNELSNKKEVTITEVSDPMITIDIDGYTNKRVKRYHDMEGGSYREGLFNEKQLEILNKIHNEGKSWPFLCSPDVSYEMMDIMYRFVRDHDLAKMRLGYWKITRSRIYNTKALQVVLILFNEGYLLPDLMILDSRKIKQLEKHHDYIFKEGGFLTTQLLIDLYATYPHVKDLVLEFLNKKDFS